MATTNSQLSEALQEASLFLEAHNFPPELAQQYWRMTFDWDLTKFVEQLRLPVAEADINYYQQVLQRIVQDEPIQYILGRCEFLGDNYEVTPATLIPREETAALVQIIREDLQPNTSGKLLDIGTGSGIIAISLAKAFPQLQVTGIDISSAALEVASRNAQRLNQDVRLLQSDLFQNLTGEVFDVIVSNPPYIAVEEMPLMDESVKKFEPAIALYAANHGLAIYQRILAKAEEYLTSSGRLYFEIGFQQGEAVKQIVLEYFPKANIHIVPDFQGLDRYICVEINGGSSLAGKK